jgi:hypothetical protein
MLYICLNPCVFPNLFALSFKFENDIEYNTTHRSEQEFYTVGIKIKHDNINFLIT